MFTFSMHGAGNFPTRKQISDMDIPLPDGTNDNTYLRCVLARSKLSASITFADGCVVLSSRSSSFPLCDSLTSIASRSQYQGILSVKA